MWDFQGHLRAQGQVDANGAFAGNKTAYAYDASGMRLSQATLSAAGAVTDATSYLWDGDRVSEERDQNGVLGGVYEHGQELGPLRLLRKKDAGVQARYFVGDGQDSTRQLLDENGAVKDSYFRVSTRSLSLSYDNDGNLTDETGQDGLGVEYANTWTYDAVGTRVAGTTQ